MEIMIPMFLMHRQLTSSLAGNQKQKDTGTVIKNSFVFITSHIVIARFSVYRMLPYYCTVRVNIMKLFMLSGLFHAHTQADTPKALPRITAQRLIELLHQCLVIFPTKDMAFSFPPFHLTALHSSVSVSQPALFFGTVPHMRIWVYWDIVVSTIPIQVFPPKRQNGWWCWSWQARIIG